MEVQAAPDQGLPPDIGLYDLSITRHALDALQERGLTMLDVVNALRLPPHNVRRDIKSGHFIIRDKQNRIVVRLDSSARTANIITFARVE